MFVIVPIAAIEAFKSRRDVFQYTDEERDLMKSCIGSLKERQELSGTFFHFVYRMW